MKKKYLTEFDEIQDALSRVRMDENVMPYYRGRLIESEDTYNKIQKLLDCPQMAESHRFLYDLDVEDLEESEIDKVDALFDLGVKKGFIDNSFEEEIERETEPQAVIADEPEDCCGRPGCSCGKVMVPCWTVLYSATKDGNIKSGECYSNAISVSAAKADCLAKLARFGYENVSILAIEACDPDCCDVNEDDLLRNRPHNAHKSVDEDEVEEDDLLKNRPHNAHKSVNEEEETDEDDDLQEAKNPYSAGMKFVTGDISKKAKKAAKKVEEDDAEDEGGDDTGSDDTGSDDAGSDDAGSDDAGSDDTGDDAGDEGGDDAGSDDAGDDAGDEGGDDAGSDDDAGDDASSDDSDGDEDSDEDSEDEDSDDKDKDEDSEDEDSDDEDEDEELDDATKA